MVGRQDHAATVAPVRHVLGWRCISLQIADIDTVHNDLRNKAVCEALAPVTLGSVAEGGKIALSATGRYRRNATDHCRQP